MADHLLGDWSDWFDGLTVARLPNGNTLLVRDVIDQAASQRLIQKASALGLSLVAVNRELG